jgi:hypothetical protein
MCYLIDTDHDLPQLFIILRTSKTQCRCPAVSAGEPVLLLDFGTDRLTYKTNLTL